MKTSLCFSADFETTTDLDDCRVWAYSLSNVENPKDFRYGNSLDDFMKFCSTPKENYTMYFFNLKFDGAFIISWLIKNNFIHIDDPKQKKDKTFTTLITDNGVFYSIEIYFKVSNHKINKVKILDALKLFPNFSVESLATAFGLPISKLELDYRKKRPIGHQLTKEEIEYIRNDVEIVAWALKAMFDKGLTKMTIASNAMQDFRKRCKMFKSYFPNLDEKLDGDIRSSYRGGFTYLSDKYINKEQGKGITIDVNSLYPSVMKYEEMPIGTPVHYIGKYEPDDEYPLFVQALTCRFKLKPNKIPCIQLKHRLDFISNEYLKSSDGKLITLTLTNVDLDLFLTQYHVYDLTYEMGWKFRSAKHIFDNYIDYWTEEKITAGKEGNKGKRQIAKLMLNSLY